MKFIRAAYFSRTSVCIKRTHKKKEQNGEEVGDGVGTKVERMEAVRLKATMNEIYAVFFAASESINFYGTFLSLFMIFLNAFMLSFFLL